MGSTSDVCAILASADRTAPLRNVRPAPTSLWATGTRRAATAPVAASATTPLVFASASRAISAPSASTRLSLGKSCPRFVSTWKRNDGHYIQWRIQEKGVGAARADKSITL